MDRVTDPGYHRGRAPANKGKTYPAEITTTVRGLTAEVPFDHTDAGLEHASVINCDVLHTIAQSALTTRIGTVHDDTMNDVCRAISYALGC